MIGTDRINGLGTVTVTFRKMRRGVSGSAKYSRTNNYDIKVCKYQTMRDIKRILAHECCHIKQYFLEELTYKREVTFATTGRMKCKSIAIWKGKAIKRSNYFKRGWEVEARKMEKLADRKTLKVKSIALKEKPIVIDVKPSTFTEQASTDNAKIEKTIYDTLAQGKVRNDIFTEIVLKRITDKQEKMFTLKRIFNMKEHNLIKQVIIDSIVYIELA